MAIWNKGGNEKYSYGKNLNEKKEWVEIKNFTSWMQRWRRNFYWEGLSAKSKEKYKELN